MAELGDRVLLPLLDAERGLTVSEWEVLEHADGRYALRETRRLHRRGKRIETVDGSGEVMVARDEFVEKAFEEQCQALADELRWFATNVRQ